jgi:pheromone shutdown protein TraB
MFGTYHPVQQYHIAGQRLHLRHYESIKTCTWNFSIHSLSHILHFRAGYFTHFQDFAVNLLLFICSKEEVELCKRRDLLEEMLALMSEEFPALGTVFVNERDVYLTHSLQTAAQPQHTPTGLVPNRTGNFKI